MEKMPYLASPACPISLYLATWSFLTSKVSSDNYNGFFSPCPTLPWIYIYIYIYILFTAIKMEIQLWLLPNQKSLNNQRRTPQALLELPRSPNVSIWKDWAHICSYVPKINLQTLALMVDISKDQSDRTEDPTIPVSHTKEVASLGEELNDDQPWYYNIKKSA